MASAGSISTPASRSATRTSCTGRSSTRTGTSCAPNATRPACARTTMRRKTPSPPHGRRSASVARPVMARARPMSPGRMRMRAGKPSTRTIRRASSSASTNGGTPAGRTTQRPEMSRAPIRPRSCARRSRPAASATRGAGRSRRAGFRAIGSRTPMSSRRFRAASISPTGRWRTKSTITAPSSRARCFRRASPAATAMIRTARS